MVDIARDARWGRVAEGAGEDPVLGAAFAAARVRGFQGDDYSRPDKVVATAKHWVAYGAAEAGRDYNTVDMSERTLRTVGQAPLYYNHMSTGRPPDEKDKYTSKYLDVAWTPLFPFGHGLSYTQFTLSGLRLSAAAIAASGSITVSAEVENVGPRAGDEVVQWYVQDVVSSVTRPVQELKGFERVTLNAGERRRVQFTLTPEHLGFFGLEMKWTVEPGEFRVRVSNSSVGGLQGMFRVTP